MSYFFYEEFFAVLRASLLKVTIKLTNVAVPYRIHMAQPHYLSTRANWEAAANETGASLESAVAGAFRAYLNETYPGQFQVDSHPTDFKQLYLEEDHRRSPETYVKPAAPVEGDIWFDEARQTFLVKTAKGVAVAQCGCVPDVKVTCLTTKKPYFIECKAQNDAGNAHERACKFATPSMITAMQRKLGVDYHPIGYLFSGDMITKKKYILELQLSFNFAPGHLIMWPKARQTEPLVSWFETTIKRLIT